MQKKIILALDTKCRDSINHIVTEADICRLYLLIYRNIFLLDFPDNLPWINRSLWSTRSRRPGMRRNVPSFLSWSCWSGPCLSCLRCSCVGCYQWTVFQPVDGEPVWGAVRLDIWAGIILLCPDRDTHVVSRRAGGHWLGRERPRDRHGGRMEGVLAALWTEYAGYIIESDFVLRLWLEAKECNGS